MPTLQQKVIAIAKAEVGTREGRSNGHWNNDQKYSNQVPGLEWSDFQPWCATFVSWVAMKAGAADLYPRTASCDAAGAWYKTRGRWSEYPAIGAQGLCGVPRDLSHTFIVTDYDDTYVYTVEGNTNLDGSREGNGVYARKRLRRSDDIIGYGYPAFPGGIKSADPAWATGEKVRQPAERVDPTPTGGLRIDGVDISHHQSNVTLARLKAAKAAGVKWVYHKATEGWSFTDTQYGARRRLCAAAGIPFGAYHFAKPAVSSGVKQAQQFLAYAKPRPGDMRPMLDLEDQDGMTRSQLTRWVGAFVGEVKRQTGVLPIIYTPFDLGDNFGCRLWVARYSNTNAAPKVPAPWKRWRIRQFSNGVYGKPNTVAGLGHVDLNTMHDEPLGSFRIPTASEPVPEPAPTPAPPSDPVPQPEPPASPPPVLTFTHDSVNVQHTDPRVDTNALIAATMAGGPGVIGWQEIEDPDEVAALRGNTDYEHFLPGNPAPDEEPPPACYVAVSWKKEKFELVDSESIRVHGGQAGVTPSRYINIVVLRDRKTGLLQPVINTQVVHHYEQGGRVFDYKGAEVEKFALQPGRAQLHIALLASTITRWSAVAPVQWAGDLNCNYLAETALKPADRVPWFPLTVLGAVCTFDNPTVGTHGSRLIDQGGHTPGLTNTRTTVGQPTTSDHRRVRRLYARTA
jgi:GH25 family lysozyme M1 (1,4-beta-N-acetylmuramidase)